MPQKKLKPIFLAASIPLKNRHPKYYSTADFISIRDAVIALTKRILGKYRIIWGGHPSITPLIEYIINYQNEIPSDYMTLYQSLYFKDKFPASNETIKAEIIYTPNVDNDRNKSLALMRDEMLSKNQSYVAGVFIGGMDGVEKEFDLFKENHLQAKLIPIPTTGAAAKILFDENKGNLNLSNDEYLLSIHSYSYIFEKLL